MGKMQIIIVVSSHDSHEFKWENAYNVFSLILGIEYVCTIITVVVIAYGSASIKWNQYKLNSPIFFLLIQDRGERTHWVCICSASGHVWFPVTWLPGSLPLHSSLAAISSFLHLSIHTVLSFILLFSSRQHSVPRIWYSFSERPSQKTNEFTLKMVPLSQLPNTVPGQMI